MSEPPPGAAAPAFPPPIDPPPPPATATGENTGGVWSAPPAASTGFSPRAVSYGFLVLTLWVFLLNTMYCDNAFRLQQIILLMGFGALLTMFLVKAVFDFLPASWRLRPAETAVFFTMLLIGIPSAMLGRLALESAAVTQLTEIADNKAGEYGFVPPHWAPQGHVRLPAHLTPMDPLEPGTLLTPEESVVQAQIAAYAARMHHQQVLMDYVFAQQPKLAATWEELVDGVRAQQQPVMGGGGGDGEFYLAWLQPDVRPPVVAPAGFAAFKLQFDTAKSEAEEIFAPLAAVVDDARRYSIYVEDVVKHPPADDAAAATVSNWRERIARGVGATESCRDALQMAQADIRTRLEELQAGYAAIRGLYEGHKGAGKAGVPWRLWIGPMCFWGAVMVAFHGLAFAFLLSMRKVWVENERLPFPYAILPERLDRALPGGAPKQSLFPSYWLYLPFLIGLGLCLPSILGLSAQATTPPPPNPTANLRDLSIERWDIKLNVDTWTLALILLFPLDLIFSVLFFYFLGAYVAPYIARLFGIEGFGQNLIPYQMLRMGGFLGLFVGTVWFNRSTVWQLMTGRKPPPAAGAPTPPDTDPLRPMVVTAVFWISLIALAALLMSGAVGGSITTLILFLFGLFVVIVYNFQEWRIRAEGGFCGWDFNNIMKVQTWSNWYLFGLKHSNPDPATQLALPQQQLAWQQLYHTGLLGTYVPTLGPGAYFLEAFRIGDLMRASPRAILKAALLAFGFALVVGMPIYLWGIYHYGLANEPLHATWFNFGHHSDKIFRYYLKKSDGGPFGTATGEGWKFFVAILFGNNWKNTFLWTLAGAACVVVLMHYRRNKPRFPFNPIGFVLAGMGSSNTQLDAGTIWFAWLIALVIKYIIHDWFGVRVFRTKVEPTILYLILGLLAGILVYAVLVVARLHFGVTWLERAT